MVNIFIDTNIYITLMTNINDNKLFEELKIMIEEGIAIFNELSDSEFKKLIRKQYNYIKQIAKEGFY